MNKIGPAIVLALLVFAAPAAAKEVSAAKLCGPSGCVDVTDHNALQVFHEGGQPVDPPLKGAPWYRARITVRAEQERHTFSALFVPALRLIRSGDQIEGQYLWTPISSDAARTISVAAGELDPFPASKLVGTGPLPPPKVRVDEVILPEDPIVADEGGTDRAWVFGGAGALLLVGAGGMGLRRRRRNDQA